MWARYDANRGLFAFPESVARMQRASWKQLLCILRASTTLHCGDHPAGRFAGAEKFQRCTLHCRRIPFALRHRDQQIAAPRHADADCGMPRTVSHLEIIGPDTSGHVGEADHPARLQRRTPLADQIEIGDAVDLAVIGDAAVAIAEADLRPDIDLDLIAACDGAATKRAAGGPAVARKRPGNLLPGAAARLCILVSRAAGQRA